MKAAWLTILLIVSSCFTQPKPFDYTPVEEVKPGPGLLSGEDGVFTLYRKTVDTQRESPDAGAGETRVIPASPGD